MPQVEHFHFIGIGGIGMSAIASLCRARGYGVSGSDLKESALLGTLRSAGVRIYIGHDSGHLGNADVVVYSSAVKEDNPELREARVKGIRILRRAEVLAWLMAEATVITVAGSHGKTTTSSLAGYLLARAGLAPTIAVGGIARNFGANAAEGQGEYFVAEADESDGSFLCYAPDYSIITNIDREHLDYYRDFESEVEAFGRFLNQTKEGGCVFYCADDPVLRKVAGGYAGRKISFGLGEECEVHAVDITLLPFLSEFQCVCRGESLGRFRLALAGRHNISNALSVIALGVELKIGLSVIREALETYQGTKRRCEIKYRSERLLVLDDYAHHPTEIRATLSALRAGVNRRIVAVFQPHRFTRTRDLLDEFGACFGDADVVLVTDIYAAGEPPLHGISGEALAARVRAAFPEKRVYYVPRPVLLETVRAELRDDDLVVTLGAGDITRVCDDLVGTFAGECAA
jgi:UDP-N-acetylmuramate--alanine ligase